MIVMLRGREGLKKNLPGSCYGSLEGLGSLKPPSVALSKA